MSDQLTKVTGEGTGGISSVTSFSESSKDDIAETTKAVDDIFSDVLDKPAEPVKTEHQAELKTEDAQGESKDQELKSQAESQVKSEESKVEKPDEKLAEAPKAEPVAKVDPTTEPGYDKEIDSLELHKNASQASKDNFKLVKSKAKEYKGLAERAVAGAVELEKKLAEMAQTVGADPSKLKQELDELRAFRRSFDVANDPEFKNQFDNKIAEIYESILPVLHESGLAQNVIDEIKKNGGLGAMSPQVLNNLLYNKETGYLTLMKNSSDPTDVRNAAVLERKIESIYDLKHQREQKIHESSKSSSEYFAKQQEAQKKQVETYIQEETQHISALRQAVKTEAEKFGLPTGEEQVPDGATAEQKAGIEKRNAIYKNFIVPTFNNALYANSTQQKVANAVAAVAMPVLRSHVQNLEKQLADKIKFYEGEISRLRGAGSVPIPGAAPSTQNIKNNSQGLSLSDHFDKIFDEVGVPK